MVSVNRSFKRPLDWSRSRAGFQGYPECYVSFGTVGHNDNTPAYLRVENGDVLVEVTLTPSGDEVVARLNTESMDQGGVYFPLAFGQRVVVAFPNASNSDGVILGRCSDESWPFPEQVSGVSTTNPEVTPDGTTLQGPLFGFIKTGDGQILAIQTGDDGDLLLTSGASVRMEVSEGEQVLIRGRTHIGSEVDFEEQPTGGKVGEGGFIQQGEPGTPYEPPPNTNTIAAPPPILAITPVIDPFKGGNPYPADGVVRMKDTIQINGATAPDFIAWGLAVTTAVNLAAPGSVPPFPLGIDGKPVSSSFNTTGDD